MNTEHTDTYTTNDHLNFPQSTAAATLNVPSEASAPRPVPSTVPFASASDTIGDVVRPPVESEDLTGTNVEYGTFDPNEGNDDRSQAGGGDEDKAGGDEGGGGRGHHANRGGRRGKGYASRGGFKKKQEGEQGKKGKDLGRTAYSRNLEDQRKGRSRNEENRAKRQKVDGDNEANGEIQEQQEEGEKEERRPKRKVAVLVGYCGHGYKGMQLNPPTKTIEGDLFEAFVKAGAISRANSNDPKKSSLVRCARTDKGVHAAGNVISLKLIIEEPDIIEKINSHLPEQIRVWDIIRTLGSFNCYQQCDSRKYEYLLPTHVFIPPHPNTFLGRSLRKQAKEENEMGGWMARQEEVATFWDDVQKKIDPLVEQYGAEMIDAATEVVATESESEEPIYKRKKRHFNDGEIGAGGTTMDLDLEPTSIDLQPKTPSGKLISDDLLKKIKGIYITEKKAWRIPEKRLERVREVLKMYEGTNNFYNYTVQKKYGDASAKRFIRTFVAKDPIIINGTEYISLQVHGQSFMMHQIRKMVGMALLIIRTGCSPSRIADSYGPTNLPIPKAPGVGLLLEQPLFNSYNKKITSNTNPGIPDRQTISFELSQEKIDAFKEKFIYQRMFYEEEKGNLFHSFVGFIDGFKNPAFTYLGSKGLKIVEEAKKEGTWLASGKEIKQPGPDGSEDEDDEVLLDVETG